MDRRLLLALALVVTVAGISHLQTSAHAELERSTPAAGAELDRVPSRVDLWFTEELADGSTAEVVGPNGERGDTGDAAIDLFDPERKHLVVTLSPDLQAGDYTVNWTTVSGEDDDTETGSFDFSLLVSATPVASPFAAASPDASPEASPASDSASARVLGQTPSADDAPKPDLGDFLIAIGVGLGAAVLIYGFWLLVKPRK